MPQTKTAIAHTDGACLGNPGPMGAAFVLTDPEGAVLTRQSIPLGRGTNNIAEYHAVIAALKAAAELGITDLVVQSDSELLVKQMRGQYQVKNPGLRPLHAQVRELMRAFASVRFQHVPRELNTLADELANAAASASQTDPPRPANRLDL